MSNIEKLTNEQIAEIVDQKVIESIPYKEFSKKLNTEFNKSIITLIEESFDIEKLKKSNSLKKINQLINNTINLVYCTKNQKASNVFKDKLSYVLKSILYLKKLGYEDFVNTQLTELGIKEIIFDDAIISEIKKTIPELKIDINIKDKIDETLIKKQDYEESEKVITEERFNELPNNVKYNKNNRSGLKANKFNDLIQNKLVNDKEKIRKNLLNKIDNTQEELQTYSACIQKSIV